MAKRHTKTGQRCPFCGATNATSVFEEPTKRKTGAFKYAVHDRAEGGRCDQSNQPQGMARWPNWAMQLNESAIKGLEGR